MPSTAPWTPADADALRVAVGRFVRAGRRHDAIPRAQAAALGYLDRDGPLSISELAGRARVRHQSMRETVALLRDAGTLRTARSPSDARRIICSITPDGRAMLERDREARTAWISAAVGRQLSPEEQATARTIAGLLERLAQDGERADEPAT